MSTLLPGTDLDLFPLVLGGNVFGWSADEATSFDVLDAFAAAGGTMVDSADAYARWLGNGGGESETIIGAWMAAPAADKIGDHSARTSSTGRPSNFTIRSPNATSTPSSFFVTIICPSTQAQPTGGICHPAPVKMPDTFPCPSFNAATMRRNVFSYATASGSAAALRNARGNSAAQSVPTTSKYG